MGKRKREREKGRRGDEILQVKNVLMEKKVHSTPLLALMKLD